MNSKLSFHIRKVIWNNVNKRKAHFSNWKLTKYQWPWISNHHFSDFKLTSMKLKILMPIFKTGKFRYNWQILKTILEIIQLKSLLKILLWWKTIWSWITIKYNTNIIKVLIVWATFAIILLIDNYYFAG